MAAAGVGVDLFECCGRQGRRESMKYVEGFVMAGASRRAFFYCNASAAGALAPVPHFFFLTFDAKRLLHPGRRRARVPRQAAETAAAIGRDLLPKGVARSVTVEGRNQHGQRVATATVTLAVDRVDPEPIPPGDNARR
jgi:hypothetical protein